MSKHFDSRGKEMKYVFLASRTQNSKLLFFQKENQNSEKIFELMNWLPEKTGPNCKKESNSASFVPNFRNYTSGIIISSQEAFVKKGIPQGIYYMHKSVIFLKDLIVLTLDWKIENKFLQNKQWGPKKNNCK